MEKQKMYHQTLFSAEVLQRVVQQLESQCSYKRLEYGRLSVDVDGATWSHDNVPEFWSDYRRATGFCSLTARDSGNSDRDLTIKVFRVGRICNTSLSVKGPNRSDIEAVFENLEAAHEESKLPDEYTGKIFIGHGGSPLWRELRDHLQDQHQIAVEAYEIGARAGHGVRDILESMLENSSMAFLVMTGEDETIEDEVRARQNVVHELGLFQGRLGFSKAIAVVEKGTELFSNLHGIQQLRFSKGNIREIFGDVLATINRERR